MLFSGLDVVSKWEQHAAKRDYKVVPEKLSVIFHFLNDCRTILDLGCGDGIYMSHLARRGEFVVGLDLSKLRLRNAKKKGDDLIRASLEKLPFKSHAFDAVWSSEVIEHLPSLEVLSDIERVTRKLIVIVIPNSFGPYYWMDKTHILRYSIRSLTAFLSKREWNYELHGLGLATRIPVPRFLRVLFFKVSWRLSYLAFTLVLIGTKGESPIETQNKAP